MEIELNNYEQHTDSFIPNNYSKKLKVPNWHKLRSKMYFLLEIVKEVSI